MLGGSYLKIVKSQADELIRHAKHKVVLKAHLEKKLIFPFTTTYQWLPVFYCNLLPLAWLGFQERSFDWTKAKYTDRVELVSIFVKMIQKGTTTTKKPDQNKCFETKYHKILVTMKFFIKNTKFSKKIKYHKLKADIRIRKIRLKHLCKLKIFYSSLCKQ